MEQKALVPPVFALLFSIRIVIPPGVFFRTDAYASVFHPGLVPVNVVVVQRSNTR